MLQPLGGRTASSILAEEIIAQYIDPKGPNCVSSLSPGVREATLERWAVIGKDYSRLQRTFFDTCRGEVERGELAELSADFKAYQVMPTHRRGDLPWWLNIGYWFSERPFILALAALLAAVLVGFPLYYSLKAHGRRRLAGSDDE